MPNNKLIGSRISQFRKEKKLTQSQLGKLIGKTESSIQKYEKGVTEVPLSVLEKIAEALDVNIVALMDIGQLTQAASFFTSTGELDKAEILFDLAIAQFDAYSNNLKLLVLFDLLNETGQAEALKRIEELTFIGRYKSSKDTSTLNAAHEIEGATQEDKDHDDAIMDNEDEWK